jgi:hypothetical protein
MRNTGQNFSEKKKLPSSIHIKSNCGQPKKKELVLDKKDLLSMLGGNQNEIQMLSKLMSSTGMIMKSYQKPPQKQQIRSDGFTSNNTSKKYVSGFDNIDKADDSDIKVEKALIELNEIKHE